ncbi:hypothetical protein WJX72_006793 [[Myrmecia] bisecta]|uniref:J domain-containing protein n=1 Tax=[Myrmecia] bisecta TaxID=41462 RepID=A0AAW1P6W2_9CHLO
MQRKSCAAETERPNFSSPTVLQSSFQKPPPLPYASAHPVSWSSAASHLSLISHSRCPWAQRSTEACATEMTTPLIAGLAVGAAAYAAKAAVEVAVKLRSAPPRMRQFYKGGFQSEMNRREAALILGVRESAPEEKVKEAHRRIMVANHPDSGGSSYIAAKVNEAKDMLVGKGRSRSSAF